MQHRAGERGQRGRHDGHHDRVQPAGHESPARADALRDVGVETAGRWQVTSQFRHRDRDDQAHGERGEIGQRGGHSGLPRVEGDRVEDAERRRDLRDRLHEDPGQADGPPAQVGMDDPGGTRCPAELARYGGDGILDSHCSLRASGRQRATGHRPNISYVKVHIFDVHCQDGCVNWCAALKILEDPRSRRREVSTAIRRRPGSRRRAQRALAPTGGRTRWRHVARFRWPHRRDRSANPRRLGVSAAYLTASQRPSSNAVPATAIAVAVIIRVTSMLGV